VGKMRRWAGRTTVQRDGTDQISVEFVEDRDEALDAVLEKARVRKTRRQGQARAERNAVLTTPLGEQGSLVALKRKLMR
jgi:hypothetical protein